MNRLHLYHGRGKGKTTAGMGLALRCAGHGRRVLIAQFLKDGTSGELIALRALPEAEIADAPQVAGFFTQMTAAEQARVRAALTAFAEALAEKVAAEKPAMILLDELAVALTLGAVEEPAARRLIDACLEAGETVITGGDAPAWLAERADYVTRMEPQRHPWATEQLPARAGVEY